MSESFQERRRHQRHQHHFMLFFYLKGKKDVTYEMSQVNNISLSGINFSSCTKFPKGSDICVELKTPFQQEPIHIEGVLLDCIELLPHAGIFRFRLEFRDVPQETIAILKQIETYKM